MEGIAGVLWGKLSNCTYWAQATFFYEQLFPLVARTWLEYKKDFLFLGPRFQFLAHKSEFCHMIPIFVDGSLLTLGMTVIIEIRISQHSDVRLIIYLHLVSTFLIGNISVVVTKKHIYECLSGYSSFQASKRRPLSIWSILIIPDPDQANCRGSGWEILTHLNIVAHQD